MPTPSIEAVSHKDAHGALRRLAIPSGLAMGTNELLGIADMVVLGALGTTAQAGLAGANGLVVVFVISLTAFGMGLRIIAAQTVGAADTSRFGTLVRSAAVAPLAIAFAAILVSAIAGAPVLRAMLPAGYDVAAAARYLTLRSWCLVPMVGIDILSSALASTGDSRLWLRAAAVVNAVHWPLLCVLALGFGTHRAYGIVGAGTSSLVAQTCGFAFALWAVARRPRLQVLRSWRVDPRLVLGSATLSWPQFAYLVLIIGAEPITVGLLAAQGVATVAAFRALTIVNDLVLVVPDALSDAAQIVLGQRIGARDASGAERFLREAVRVNVLACGAVGAGVAALAWPLAAACTWNAALATAAAGPLAIQAGLMLPIKGYALALAAPIRAAGDTRFMMLVGVSASALALAVTALSIRRWHFGLYCVPLAWGLAWILRSALTAWRVRRGDWRTKTLAIEG